MTEASSHIVNIERLLPSDMAHACEAAGVAKASRDWITLLVLGVLAGAFIALGAMFMTVVATGSGDLPFGVARLLAGMVFSLGLIVVVVGGAELFTGDVLMIVAYASGRVSARRLMRAWLLVYVGNTGGAVGTAVLVFLAGHHGLFDGRTGSTALMIANAKAIYPTGQLFFLALLCNVLVCLAIWMTFAAQNVTDKVVVIVPAITAFVAAGFEHSIANLYLLPYALMIKWMAGAAFWDAIGQNPVGFDQLNVANALHNIAVSTIGNLIGGSVLVGVVYWFVYLRPKVRDQRHVTGPSQIVSRRD